MKKYRFLSIVIAAMMLLTCVSCGEKTPENEPVTVPETETPALPETVVSPPETSTSPETVVSPPEADSENYVAFSGLGADYNTIGRIPEKVIVFRDTETLQAFVDENEAYFEDCIRFNSFVEKCDDAYFSEQVLVWINIPELPSGTAPTLDYITKKGSRYIFSIVYKSLAEEMPAIVFNKCLFIELDAEYDITEDNIVIVESAIFVDEWIPYDEWV